MITAYAIRSICDSRNTEIQYRPCPIVNSIIYLRLLLSGIQPPALVTRAGEPRGVSHLSLRFSCVTKGGLRWEGSAEV